MVLFYYILQVGVVLSIASLSFFLYQKLSTCYTNHKTLKLEMANLRVQVMRTTPEKDEKLKTLYKDNPTAIEIIENATKNRNVRLYSVNSVETYRTPEPQDQDSIIKLNIARKQYKKVENQGSSAKILPLN